MPQKTVPKCVNCNKTESLLWSANATDEGELCNDCVELRETNVKDKEEEVSTDHPERIKNHKGHKLPSAKDKEQKEGDIDKEETTRSSAMSLAEQSKRLRKSTRSTRFKAKAPVSTSGGVTTSSTSSNKTQIKGKSRRSIFKRQPFKLPLTKQATTHLVKSTFYKDLYMQIGDIVSLVDAESNVYYAQIRALLIDEYGEKSAFLTWLIPTQASPDPRECFDPATYIIGPDEELSRKLSCMEFVMHAPSDYYFDRKTPYPLPATMDEDTSKSGYMWVTLKAQTRTSERVATS